MASSAAVRAPRPCPRVVVEDTGRDATGNVGVSKCEEETQQVVFGCEAVTEPPAREGVSGTTLSLIWPQGGRRVSRAGARGAGRGTGVAELGRAEGFGPVVWGRGARSGRLVCEPGAGSRTEGQTGGAAGAGAARA